MKMVIVNKRPHSTILWLISESPLITKQHYERERERSHIQPDVKQQINCKN